MPDAEGEPDGRAMAADRAAAGARPDEVVFVRDIASGRVTWSPAIRELFGYAPADVAPTVDWWAERLHPEDRERVLQGLRGAHDGHLLAAEYRFRRADGTYADVLGQAYALNDASGAPAIAIGSIRYVPAAARPIPQELGHSILHDALTDLPNRHLLGDRLAQAIAVARRERRSVGLLFIDLDDFKAVNDTLGHAAGDAALREVAARLRAALREQDTVARVGGDEFAVVLPHTDTAGALDAARKLRQALDPALLVEGQRCHVSASVGIAIYPLHSLDEFDLVRHADVALYSAKRAGTGFAVYDADAARPATLTAREREVLELMAEGLGNADIAARLVISITTVRSHVRSIIEKLGVHSRLQAVVGAYELSARGMFGGDDDAHARAIN